MQPLINWANANQGFLTAILTLIYVVATLLLVCFAYRQLRQQERSQRQQAHLSALALKLHALTHLHNWNNAQGKSHFAVQNFNDIQETQKQLDALLSEMKQHT
ncbi:MAG: hypothetical protein M3N48_07295 [Verrucomicrobiota bacterium]|nr:hypothetical protein [Verrucomicrobiota bacterium]